MKKSQRIANEIAQKRQAVADLFKQHGDNMPADVASGVEAKLAEIEAQQKELDQAVKLEKAAEENDAELKRLNETPSNAVPLPAGGKAGDARLEGYEPAGHSVIDRKTLGVVYEEGVLGLDQKTMVVISGTSYKQAFRKYLRGGIHALGATDLKALQEGTDSQGGFLVPDDVLGYIIQRKPTPTRIFSRVTRLQTSRDRLLIPKVNYTADNIFTTGIRVSYVGETPTVNQHRVNEPVFGQVEIPVYTAMMSMPITRDMIEDSAFPIVGWAADKFRETIDLNYDQKIVSGSGVKQPAGILMNPGGESQPAVVNSGDANLLTPDGIIDLSYTLPEQYDENACFLLNKTSSGRAIAKMKDGDDRYLFGYGQQDSGLAGGRPKELVGYDYLYSAFMPDVAANNFPIIFGDPTGYYHVERIGFSIEVLREVGAEQNELRLLGRLRHGGQVAEDFKLKVQKVAA